MRKVISILCALAIIFSMSGVAIAAEAPAQEIPIGSEIHPNTEGNSGIMPCEPVLTFNLLQPGDIAYTAEGRVEQGVTKLHITSCTWYPANTIWIGFSSLSTGKQYSVEFSNGSINNFTITTENVPSGTYYVFVRNQGNSGIGSGTMYYEWIG